MSKRAAEVTCSHWSGCGEPPVEGRPYCATHSKRTDELSAIYRDREAQNAYRAARVRMLKEAEGG